MSAFVMTLEGETEAQSPDMADSEKRPLEVMPCLRLHGPHLTSLWLFMLGQRFASTPAWPPAWRPLEGRPGCEGHLSL